MNANASMMMQALFCFSAVLEHVELQRIKYT